MKELSKEDKVRFRKNLSNWYNENYRKLPWRSTKNPYKIWLSEIILQQTRIQQGLNYYNKFLQHYPRIEDLANASEDAILKDWQGLGYYSRARNLHHAAKQIMLEHKGEFPDNYSEIRKLKGVGDYTAAAIASFSFKLPYAVVDGNVYRFLSRYFGIDTPIDSTHGVKYFKNLAQELIDPMNPSLHNQAMMEIGAIVCTPKKTLCSSCPFVAKCSAYRLNKVELLPVKMKKLKQNRRYFHYLLLEHNETIIIKKREEKGIWQNLYDFPLIESTGKRKTRAEIEQVLDATFQYKSDFELVHISEQRKHVLSHQIILARFYHMKLKNTTQPTNNYLIINRNELKQFAIPRLIDKYLIEETNLLSLDN